MTILKKSSRRPLAPPPLDLPFLSYSMCWVEPSVCLPSPPPCPLRILQMKRTPHLTVHIAPQDIEPIQQPRWRCFSAKDPLLHPYECFVRAGLLLLRNSMVSCRSHNCVGFWDEDHHHFCCSEYHLFVVTRKVLGRSCTCIDEEKPLVASVETLGVGRGSRVG